MGWPLSQRRINNTVSPPAPLTAGLDTTNGTFGKHATAFYSHCNLYVGSDFVVKVPNWLAMNSLIADDTMGGITQCEFSLTGETKELRFSVGGYKLLTLPNAGGNSVLSEALSFEVLQRCFRATLLKTEMEVEYFPKGGSMTDYVCSLWGHDIAVSVTRAMKFRGTFTLEDAQHLLNKKLKGVQQSTHNAMDKWSKQILHVWATSTSVAQTLAVAYYTSIDPKVKSNTVVLITTATKTPFIFENG